MAIYTKKGDRGKTAIYDPKNSQRKRISKSSLRIKAIGSVDELNSYIGVVVSETTDKKLIGQLEELQGNLLRIGSILAGSDLRFFESKTKTLEKNIDELEGTLPVLKNFILPGGDRVAAKLHFARTLARKAERMVVAYSEEGEVKPQIFRYLNRLSDYLFMLARKVNSESGKKEQIWKK